MKRTIYIAGHAGMVGSALGRRLTKERDCQLLLPPRNSLDLRDQDAVVSFLAQERPDEVYMAAAKVGGIAANSRYPADFLYDNLMIAANLIHAAHATDVQKLLFLGSSCIYPRNAAQPIREDQLLTGPLEPTNAAYAIAKIAGLELCASYNRQHGRDYRCLMPTNLYGPNDNFHPRNSHVIPALMRRFHEAKVAGAAEVVIWGTGTPLREFLHVDDLADACVHVMGIPEASYKERTLPVPTHVNVGTGVECSIAELARLMAEVTGFQGRIGFDTSQPDGTPRKLLDCKRLEQLGWRAGISLEQGLRDTYQWFLDHQAEYRD